ncbi:hypothetical protein BOX37_17420 [Nocardia mangyaensis]|uniref:HTH luxR-type domain-containing protein n=1 Tax=Nocardia mangyaensis TaxID=2213200 RepID=A0A1J0VTU1_9NOCA|nr:LuxR family transcriptional regulator [Nocardia mangyaensis]APE35433.1 hypothetical protein BOX37_17420 [Nocardia mangyaensis]
MAGITGRAELAEALTVAWNSACAGAGRVIVLLGEPGIGKSSMLSWLAEQTGDRARLVACRAGDIGEPMSTAADVAVALRGDARPVTAQIDPLRAADLLAAAVAAATAAGPVALLIDDIHDADPASRTALNLMLRRTSWGPVLVIVTGRPVPSVVTFAEGFQVRRLAGLDAASALTVLRDACPAPIDDAVAQRLLAVSAGNPLALTHLPAALTDDQLSGDRLLPSDIPLAGELHRVFTGQLARLTPTARDLLDLTAVSVEGNWAVLAALRPDAPGAALTELEESGLAALVNGRLELAHPLLRSAAVSGLPAHRKRLLNRELAAVSALPAEVRLAHRAAGAVGPDESLTDELVATAQRMRARGGSEAAARMLDRAVELTGRDLRRAQLRVEVAQLLGASGEAGVARHRLGEVLAEPVAAGLHVLAVVSLATWEALDGEPLAAWQRLLECAALADPADMGVVHAGMAIPLGMLGLVDQIIEHATAAVAHSVPRSPNWVVSRVILAHAISARTEGQAGDLVTGLFDEWDPTVAIHHDPTVGLHIGRALSIAEQYDTAVTMLTALSGHARGEGARASLAMTYGALGETHLRASRFDQATRCLDEAIALSLATGQRAFAPFWLGLRARIHAIRGEDAAAAADFDLGFDISTEQSTFGARYFLLANAGNAALATGRAEEAVGFLQECWAFEEAGGRLAPQLARWHPDLVEAYVSLGRHQQARPVLDHLLEVAAAPGASRWTRASARRAAAVFHAETDRLGAQRLLREAIAIYDPELDLFDRARAQLLLAASGGPTGESAAARAQYAFDRMRAAPWAAKLGELDTATTGSALADLSGAELRVLREVARGLTNQQIATRLLLSPKTVANHLFRVYRKLGASSRTEAARLLLLGGDEQASHDHSGRR